MNNNPAIQNATESIQVATVNRPSKIAQIHLKNIPITDMIFSEQSFYVYRYFIIGGIVVIIDYWWIRWFMENDKFTIFFSFCNLFPNLFLNIS